MKIAVLSDCSSETADAWDEMPLTHMVDAALLSWSLGYRKPDSRGYLAAASRLDVHPSECWFVGDGGSRELWGADRVGMRPVWIASEGLGVSHLRHDADTFIPSDVVSSLADLPDLVLNDSAPISAPRT
jgi:putative hydrolase of the HAD superfamily